LKGIEGLGKCQKKLGSLRFGASKA